MLNRTLISVVTSFAMASIAVAGLTGEQLSVLKQKLVNPDPVVRKEALNELEKEHPETANNDIVPLLCSALADQDGQVRALAAALLAMVSFSTSPKFHQPNANMTDLRSYPPIQAALVAAFNDPDEETRKNALVAYLMTFTVPPVVQNTLVSRYESERQISLFRTAILEALTIDGAPTPAAKALLIRIADSPKDSTHLAQVIQDSKAAPVELLPYFATQFVCARDPTKKALLARAIRKFGASAKPYIPMLEQAAGIESDDITRKTITTTVASIRASN